MADPFANPAADHIAPVPKISVNDTFTEKESSESPIDTNNDLAALGRLNNSHSAAISILTADGKRQLTEEEAYEHLGFSFPKHKKWLILTSVFIVQLSMNFNAAIYGNSGAGLKEKFGISNTKFKVGQMLFLIMYAFGCELWAPWSEELGRKWVMQGSLFLVNVWQIPCALAPNFGTILGFRALGGLSSAGGSVTLGMVADMWEPEVQQYAVAFVVLSSVAGSVIAPIVGGFIETYLSWHWVFWIQLIFGAVAQGIHFFVPETRSDVLLDRRAKHMRKTGIDPHVYGPNEIRGNFWQRTDFKACLHLMARPYKFLATEPIVAFLSLLSGFSDALIFTGLDSFPMVLSKWSFTVVQVGLAFIPLLIGYLIAYGIFLPVYRCDREALRENPRGFKPERRLRALAWLVILEPIGLFIFAFGSLGPSWNVHWMVPLFATALIGIANFAIYMATIDYMIAAYGPYSASATGGNGFCRDFLAGIAALYTHPFYHNIAPDTDWTLPIPTLILFGVGILLSIPVWIFWRKGEWFRKRSPYAQQLEQEREEKRPMRKEAIAESKKTTPAGSRLQSRRGSPAPPVVRSRPASVVNEGDEIQQV